jgi:cytoskeletal protein RodZ
MSSVGELLQEARLAQQLDLTAVSERTRISVRYLEAIEANDRKVLPSGFFYKSFVDQYARFLGLDARAINADVERLLSADAPLPLPGHANVVSKSVPRMSGMRSAPSRVWVSFTALFAVVLGCSAIYAWWHDATPGSVARVFEKVVAPLHKNSPAPTQSVAMKPAPTPIAPVAVPIAATSDAPQAADTDPKVLLDLMAHEPTWLSVSSAGKRLFSGILGANQTKTVEGKESATMKVGNAAGIEVRLNGKLLGPLGARGQVLVVVFTPDRFQIVPPPPREGD